MADRRTAVVTGSSRGIGRATAVHLARQGLAVALVGRTPATLDDVADQILRAGAEVTTLALDVTSSDAPARIIAEITERWGRLDVVVNNAGGSTPAGVEDIDDDAWRSMLELHLTAPFLLCRSALPLLRRSDAGAIVNVASTSGLTGGTNGAHYAAAKGGLIALTRALARELAPEGIRVNAVAPSKIDTDLLRSVTDDAGYRDLSERIPLGRVGRADEVAEVIGFLASQAASFVTGQVLTASGGYP